MSEKNNNENNEKDYPEPFQWTDKSKQERVGNKMLLLVFLGIIFIVVLFIYFKSDASGNDNDDYEQDNGETENIEGSENENVSDQSSEVEEKYMQEDEDNNNDDDGNENETNHEDNSPQEESSSLPEDANEYEEEYFEKYSQELINGLKKNSKPVMDLYFAQKKDTKFWDKIGSDSFLENVDDNLAEEKEKPLSYEFFTTEPYEDDEIVMGVLAETEENNSFYNLIFKEEDNQVKLNEIVFMWDM